MDCRISKGKAKQQGKRSAIYRAAFEKRGVLLGFCQLLKRAVSVREMSGRLVCASLLALLLVASADAYSLVACPKYTVRSSEPTARSAVRSLMYPFQPNSFPDHPAHENLANEREERAVSVRQRSLSRNRSTNPRGR